MISAVYVAYEYQHQHNVSISQIANLDRYIHILIN